MDAEMTGEALSEMVKALVAVHPAALVTVTT